MKTLPATFLAGAIACAAGGCACMMDSLLDELFAGLTDTRQQREIREDYARHKEGQPLLYHTDQRELRRHAKDYRAMNQMQRTCPCLRHCSSCL